MEQKFIDKDGLKILWNQISLKDYPNNETLMAVIDSIDETKADKNELFSGSWNDLIDKPFYDTQILYDYKYDRIWNNKETLFTESGLAFVKISNDIILPENLIGAEVYIHGPGAVEPLTIVKEEDISLFEGGYKWVSYIIVCLNDTAIDPVFNFTYTKGIYVLDGLIYADTPLKGYISQIIKKSNEGKIKQLDEKYLPTSIAKINDISWCNLKDKPFYENEREVFFEWDGNPEGLGQIYFGEADGVPIFYSHVTNNTLSLDVILKTGILTMIGADNQENILNIKDMSDEELIEILGQIQIINETSFIVDSTIVMAGEDLEIEGIYIPKGCWIMNTKDFNLGYIKSLTVEKELKQLNEKFIPSSIARKDDINNLELITIEDIDTICGISIQKSEEVLF